MVTADCWQSPPPPPASKAADCHCLEVKTRRTEYKDVIRSRLSLQSWAWLIPFPPILCWFVWCFPGTFLVSIFHILNEKLPSPQPPMRHWGSLRFRRMPGPWGPGWGVWGFEFLAWPLCCPRIVSLCGPGSLGNCFLWWLWAQVTKLPLISLPRYHPLCLPLLTVDGQRHVLNTTPPPLFLNCPLMLFKPQDL